MKKILGIIIASATLLIGSGNSFLGNNIEERTEDIIESTIDNSLGKGINVKMLGKDTTLDYSPTYVQLITRGNSNYLRYVTAIKGTFSNIYYTRSAVGMDDKKVEIDSVYEGILSDDESLVYYDGETLTSVETYKGDYYWAVYTIQFTTDTYKATDFTLELSIETGNDTEIKNPTSKTTSLKDEISYRDTYNFYNQMISKNDFMVKDSNSIELESPAEYFSFNDSKISLDDSIKTGSTSFKIGSDSGNYYTAIEFDITPNYNSVEYSSITFRIRAKDVNENYEIKFSNSEFKIKESYFNDSNVLTANNIALYENAPTSLLDNTTYRFKIISYETTTTILVNDKYVANLNLSTCLESDDPAPGFMNSVRTEGFFEVYTWETAYTLENAKYVEYTSLDSLKNEYGITRTQEFYEGLSYEANQKYVFYNNELDEIINNSRGDINGNTTRIRMGRKTDNTATVSDFYITMDYENTASSSLTLRYRAWDINTNLMVRFSDSGVVKSGSSTWDDDIKGAKLTTIEPKNNVGLKQGQKHHIEIITYGWTKVIIVDDQIVMTYSENDLNVGYVSIETWQAGYTIEDAYYHEFASDYELQQTSYYDKLWN